MFLRRALQFPERDPQLKRRVMAEPIFGDVSLGTMACKNDQIQWGHECDRIDGEQYH